MRHQHEQHQQKKKKKPEKKKQEDSALDDFEDEATGDGEGHSSSEYPNEYADDDSDGGGWAAIVGTVFFETTKYLFVYGGTTSWYRAHGSPFLDPYDPGEPGQMTAPYIPRKLGEPMVPFVGLNLDYQNVESDVYAAVGRLEAGYGPAALQIKWAHYEEDDPFYALDLFQWHGLYRMSFSKYVEVDAGLGQMILDGGNRESGFSMTFPIRIQPAEYFGISFRPVWGWIGGTTITDIDLALSGGLRFASIYGGYRWTRAGRASLDGPVLGLSFYM